MTKEEFIKEIEENSECSIDKGEIFCKNLMSEYYPGQDFEYIDGSGDGGIDAYWIDEDINRINIIQSKYGESFKGPDTIRAEFTKILDKLNDESFSGREGLFNNLRELLKDETSCIRLILLTNDKLDSECKKTFSTIQQIYTATYINKSCEILNISIDDIDTSNSKLNNVAVNLKGDWLVKGDKAVSIIKSEDLYAFMKSYENLTGSVEKLFDKNLRYLLSNKINNGIQNTIINEPDKLYERNNGVRIISYGFNADNPDMIELINPNVPNGCQTCSTIYKYFKESQKQESISEVLVSIVDVSNKDDDEIDDISRYCNTQSKVVSRNFWSFDDRIKEIKTYIESIGNNYYLEVKQNELVKINKLSHKLIKTNSLTVYELISGYYFLKSGDTSMIEGGKSHEPSNIHAEKAVNEMYENHDLLNKCYRLYLLYKNGIKPNSIKFLIFIELLKRLNISILNISDRQKDYLLKSAGRIFLKYTDPNTLTKRALKDFPNANKYQRGLKQCFKISEAIVLNDMIIDFISDDYDDSIK